MEKTQSIASVPNNKTTEMPSLPDISENSDTVILLKQDTNDFSVWEGYYYFVCGICRKWFSTSSSMTIHFSGHFNDCPKCDVCGSTFTTAEDYADHCAQHVGHNCIVCDQTFFEVKNFEAHVREHKLNCLKCKKTFSSEEELNLHYYLDHKEMINFQCDICLNFFRSKRTMMFHKAIHWTNHGEGMHECKRCNVMFPSLKSRKQHYNLMHQKIKPHVCHICGKEYSKKNSLNTHLSNHAGEKPYMCLICGRRFADKRNFKRHGADHTVGQSKPCTTCGKVFNTEKQLRTHEWRHTHKGYYKCDICPRTFDDNTRLKIHLMRHNGEEPFHCRECKKGFIEKYELGRHLTKKHKLDKQKVKEILSELKQNMMKSKTEYDEASKKNAIIKKESDEG